MAQIDRKQSKIFGTGTAVGDFTAFGSYVAGAGTPTFTKDPDAIQTTEYENGAWKSAVVAQKNPFLEDMNGLQFLYSYQISYLLQAGIAEWETNTEYFIGNYAREIGGNNVYSSLTDNNSGNALTDPVNWQLELGGGAAADLPRGYIDGLIMSNATDTDHDILIGAGVAKDSTDTSTMILAASITKQIDANWAEGDNVGGFPSTLTLSADTWYHMFEISKTDGTVDAGYDTSLTASNLLIDAAAYSNFRRIGSVLTDVSSNIIQFTQFGNKFLWTTPVMDVTDVDPGTAAVSAALSTPIGVKCLADIEFQIFDNNIAGGIHYALVTSLDQADTVPASGNSSIVWAPAGGAGNNASAQTSRLTRTDTSSQIRYRFSASDASLTASVMTQGYTDLRGKE